MIVGGSRANGRSGKSYALSLDSEVPVPQCLSSIPDFPLDGYEPESTVLPDGSPFVCSSADPNSRCYKYNYTSMDWVPAAEKPIKRLVHTGSSYHSSFGLVVSGGHVRDLAGGAGDDHDEIFYTKDGNQFHRFPTKLPDKRHGHCQIAIDEDTFMIIGGAYVGVGPLASSYMFNRITGWERLPDMHETKNHNGCGLVTLPDGRKEVIVVDACHNTNTVESFDLESRRWKREDNFPFATALCAPTEGTIPFKNSFLVIGGHKGDGVDSKNIFWFNPKTRGWHKMPVELREPGHYMAAMILDETTINC